MTSLLRSIFTVALVLCGLPGCLLCLPCVAHATRFVDRWITVNPLHGEPVEGGDALTLLGAAGFWGEFATYRLERDDDHAYGVKLGGVVEMLRARNDWSLAFVSHVELVANNQNDLFFRPRVALWEEGLVWTRRAGARYWQLAYMHRCKHDIDNLGVRDCDGGGCERSLIYGSLQAKLLLPIATAGGATRGWVVARGDLFTIVQDDRTPAAYEQRRPRTDRAWVALGADLHLRRETRYPWLGTFLTAHGSTQLYGEDDRFFARWGAADQTTWNGGVVAGVALQGEAHLRLGVAYEYMRDTAIQPDPVSAHLVSFTVSMVSADLVW